MFGFAVRTRHNSSENVGSPSPVAGSSPMFAFVRRRQNSLGSISITSPTESPNAKVVDVGEIDTRAPFESVKAAVSLFRNAVSPRSKPSVTKKSTPEERVLEKETQHNMILGELDYYKDCLRSAEKEKGRALQDLERANKTLQQLTDKLETLTESKQVAMKETEAAKIRVTELEEQKSVRAHLGTDAWKLDIDSERECYKASAGELNLCKQEINNLRHDFGATLEAKFAAFQEAKEAEHNWKVNQERKSQLVKEVSGLREALDQAKLATLQTEEEHLRLVAENEALFLNYNAAIEEAEKEINNLRGECEPEDKLAGKLEETTEAIKVLHEQLNGIRASDLHSLQVVVSELNDAKEKLLEVVAEENEIRSSIDLLRLQLEEMKRSCYEIKTRALEAEASIEQMQAELEKWKGELEMQSNLEKLLAEIEKYRHEAEEMDKNALLLKQEGEVAEMEAKESEEKLQIALKQVEAAKAAVKLADEKIHDSPRTDAGDLKSSRGSNRKITLSVDEFDAMNKKIEEIRREADVKVATAMAQVEMLNANEMEASKKVEEVMKEKEIVQSETEDALKSAEMADAVRKVVEGELLKWREEEESDQIGEPSYVQ